MAKLSVHGSELLRLEYTNHRIAFMSDGKILRNDGDGWKLYRKVKPGVDPADHANKVKSSRAATDAACPAWAEYRNKLCSWVPISQRWKVATAIDSMPQDPDGVWSECCDGYGDNIHLDIDEVSELCNLYNAGKPELDAYLKQRRESNQTLIRA